MKIVEDKTITLLIINEIKCVVQSYIENDYVNLSPVQTGRESFECSLSNIRIDFVNDHITTEGKENAKWKGFVSALNIAEINNILKSKNMSLLEPDWIRIDDCLPPEMKEVKFFTGEREFIGIMDEDGIWEYIGTKDQEFHSSIDDGYITHWKEK